MDAESQLLAEKDAEIERLKALMTELICWMSDESQIVSGCRDEYERGRYDAYRQAIDFFQRAREATNEQS